MRKINKTCDLATEYKGWEENFGEEKHQKYHSSNSKYYVDVIMQLFRCQQGLCAYTEEYICDKRYLTNKNWLEGRPIYTKKPIKGIEGELDHFDSTLKSKPSEINGRKDWLWSNFFMVSNAVNNKKRDKKVDYILKPDAEDYNPFQLLEYSLEDHLFLPNINLEESKSERVNKMIDTLQINLIYHKREKFFNKILRQIYIGIKGWDEVNPHQFPTAFQMIRTQFERNENDLKDFGFV